MVLTDDTLDYLYALRRRGIKVGLHRTRALLKQCENPHWNIPMIHIAGTNGKGSTAAMIASILSETDLKVGLYTSPHLVRFNERIRVDGVPIDDDQIAGFLNRYRKDIDRLGSTFFETTTALTFHYFSREKVDIAVVEVGMGGRLDSSNVGNSILSVLAPIDMDHVEYLGHNLRSIAREKCGILRKNIPVVSSIQHDDVLKVIRESVSPLGSALYYAPETSPISQTRVGQEGTRFLMDNQTWEIPLLGEHQAINAQTAILASRLYSKRVTLSALERGLRNITWPGRLQRMCDDPPVYYDVAHNPHGLKAVLKTLRELFGGFRIGAIFALKKTKEVRPIGHLLRKHSVQVVTTAPENGDFFTPESLAHELSRLGIRSIPAPSLSEALDHSDGGFLPCDLWLVFGTHFIAEGVFRKFHFPFDKGQI